MSIDYSKDIAYKPVYVNSKRNVVFRASSQAPSQAPVNSGIQYSAPQSAAADEGSLIGNCAAGVGIFGGIRMIPHIIHPKNSLAALKDTCELFSKTKGLQELKPAEQAEAFYKLFTAARLKPRFADPTRFNHMLNHFRNNYISALEAKNPVDIARTGAQLSELADKGTKGLIFNRNPKYADVVKLANKKGTEAAEFAQKVADAKNKLEGASMLERGWAGFKNLWKSSGGWFCVALESLMELPDLIAAYSEGKTGEGVEQTAKSAVKVTINTAGWILGAAGGKALSVWAGMKACALMGTAISPGVGTVIGAVLGFVGSLAGMTIGSHFAGKLSKAVTGKSFTEKQAERLAKQQQIAMQMYQQNQLNPNYASNPFYRLGMTTKVG